MLEVELQLEQVKPKVERKGLSGPSSSSQSLGKVRQRNKRRCQFLRSDGFFPFDL